MATDTTPSIQHIVLFKFQDSAGQAEVEKICKTMLNLQQTCLAATNSKPYIKSMTGGVNISIENMKKGFTHGFVVGFATVQDRDYYVNEDPSHQAFVKMAGPVIADVIVFDYEVGLFTVQ